MMPTIPNATIKALHLEVGVPSGQINYLDEFGAFDWRWRFYILQILVHCYVIIISTTILYAIRSLTQYILESIKLLIMFNFHEDY